ncbi:MAG TPA: hypothetical protein VIT91_03340, partial [Chthoniobacterales bacterium]
AEKTFEALRRHLENRRHLEGGSIVDEDVDSTDSSGNGFDRFGDIGYATGIQAYTDRPFAGRRGDFGCRLSARRRVFGRGPPRGASPLPVHFVACWLRYCSTLGDILLSRQLRLYCDPETPAQSALSELTQLPFP